MTKPSTITEAVLATIIHFDILNYPLTELEIYKWLFNYSHRDECLGEILEKLKAAGRIHCRDGFYFLSENFRQQIFNNLDDAAKSLPSQINLVDWRLSRYPIALKKIKKALTFSRLLAILPFIRLIAVSNTLSYENVREESDIDLFIIAAEDKIWTVRLLAVGISVLLGQRPSVAITRDKFCFNFFIDEKNLDLKNIALKNDGEVDDVHLAFLMNQLLPIYNQYSIFSEFIKQNNWINKFFPNSRSYGPSEYRQIKLGISGRFFKKILEIFFSPKFIERICRYFQLKILPDNLRQVMNKSTDVVVNDKILKFHQNDRRKHFNQLFQKGREGISGKNIIF